MVPAAPGARPETRGAAARGRHGERRGATPPGNAAPRSAAPPPRGFPPAALRAGQRPGHKARGREGAARPRPLLRPRRTPRPRPHPPPRDPGRTATRHRTTPHRLATPRRGRTRPAPRAPRPDGPAARPAPFPAHALTVAGRSFGGGARLRELRGRLQLHGGAGAGARRLSGAPAAALPHGRSGQLLTAPSRRCGRRARAVPGRPASRGERREA